MTKFEPQDRNYESRVRESFARQLVMHTLGANLTLVEPGVVEIELPYRADLTQQHGFIHAGVVASILDSACGYAAYSLMPAGAAVLSIEFKVNLLAPAKGDVVRAHAEVKRAGRNVTVCVADAFAITDGQSKVVATMLATMMSILGRDDLVG
ncbi:MAG TPA: PaaI family thioesterase [Pyrinomonadaceae bacterium]|nr:PaaI family thioesterase [Pyrinomonadaceae bacterium]